VHGAAQIGLAIIFASQKRSVVSKKGGVQHDIQLDNLRHDNGYTAANPTKSTRDRTSTNKRCTTFAPERRPSAILECRAKLNHSWRQAL
jgi:hypothetical protein